MNVNLNECSVLVVEDSPEYIKLIQQALGNSSAHVYVKTISEAMHHLKVSNFDVVILDLGLPDGTGTNLLGEYPKLLTESIVVVLTAKDDISSKVMGLSTGVHDYITKPFDPLELIARIRNKVSQPNTNLKLHASLERGNLLIDMMQKQAFIDGELLDLTSKEFDLLVKFSENVDTVYSGERIVNMILGERQSDVDENAEVMVNTLKQKISGWDYSLESIGGSGYKLTIKVSSSKVDDIVTDELLEIFSSESESQIEQLEKAHKGLDRVEVARIVHCLKGTFLIFRSDCTRLFTEWEAKLRSESLSETEHKAYVLKLRKIRQEILNLSEAAERIA